MIRQLRLVQFLGARRRGATVAVMCESLAVSRATLYRYLDTLEQAGVPLVSERVNGHVRYRLVDELLVLGLGPEEIAALKLGYELMEPLQGTAVATALERLLRRMGAARRTPSNVAVSLDGPGATADPTTIRSLDVAIRHGSRLRFSYRAAKDDQASERLVDPLALRMRAQQVYLVAHDVDVGDVRVFKAIRIAGDVEVAGDAEPHPEHDEAALFAHSVGIWSGELHEVCIRISRRSARFVQEWPLHESMTVTPESDGAVRVAATVAGLEEVLRWTLRWGAEAQALEPPELRSLVGEELERAAAAYRINPDKLSHDRETGGSDDEADL